jgi:hypothetical protein
VSSEIETAVSRLVNALAGHNSIRAIGMSGGERPLPEPGEGDIDLFVYCAGIPSIKERRDILLPLHELEQVEVGKLPGGHWGQGDCLWISGIETWLLFFTIAEAQAELEAVLCGKYLGRLDSYYYPIGRCAMWKSMRIFYESDGFLQSLKVHLAEYPARLAQAVIQHHLDALEDVEDLERAVQRKDVFFFHFALDLALDHFFQALFAMNREFFPSRKRSEIYLHGFKLKPSECEQRLRQVIALGGNAETLGQSYEIWKSLMHDIKHI